MGVAPQFASEKHESPELRAVVFALAVAGLLVVMAAATLFA